MTAMEPTEKPCSKCKLVKPLDAFKRQAAGKYGRTAACKDCSKAQRRAHYAANVDDQRAKARAKYAANPEARRIWRQNWYQRDLAHTRALKREYEASRRARRLSATLGEVDMAAVLTLSQDCYLCGEQLADATHADHVVPLSRGGEHSMNNLRPTHDTCNLRKGDRLLSELDWYVGPTDIGQ